MNIYYDQELDYLEVFVKSVANYSEAYRQLIGVSVFKSERNNETVGYSFENASKSVLDFSEFDIVEKLAILLKISRLNKKWSQEEAANNVKVSLRHYQRLEAGQDTTLTQLNEIMKVFPETDFTAIFFTRKHLKAD